MLRRLIVNSLNLYQLYLRLLLPPSCRFSPTCSEYAKQAVQKYGALKGMAKAIARLLRCHPLSRRSGYDPLL